MTKIMATTQVPSVLEIERRPPAHAGGEPIQLLSRSSLAQYLEENRPGLEAQEAGELEPKRIPNIFEIWENPEAVTGLTGL